MDSARCLVHRSTRLLLLAQTEVNICPPGTHLIVFLANSMPTSGYLPNEVQG